MGANILIIDDYLNGIPLDPHEICNRYIDTLNKKIKSLEITLQCKEEYISHMRKELDRLTLELKKTDQSELDALYEENKILTDLLEIK